MALGNPLCTRAYGKIVNISRSRSRSVSTAPFTRTTGRPTGWNITLESDGAWITTGAWEATWAEAVDVAMRSNRTCALELAIAQFHFHHSIPQSPDHCNRWPVVALGALALARAAACQCRPKGRRSKFRLAKKSGGERLLPLIKRQEKQIRWSVHSSSRSFRSTRHRGSCGRTAPRSCHSVFGVYWPRMKNMVE